MRKNSGMELKNKESDVTIFYCLGQRPLTDPPGLMAPSVIAGVGAL